MRTQNRFQRHVNWPHDKSLHCIMLSTSIAPRGVSSFPRKKIYLDPEGISCSLHQIAPFVFWPKTVLYTKQKPGGQNPRSCGELFPQEVTLRRAYGGAGCHLRNTGGGGSLSEWKLSDSSTRSRCVSVIEVDRFSLLDPCAVWHTDTGNTR